MEAFIHGIPKAELHIHIEGALGPELMLELAAKNGIPLPYTSVSEIVQAYRFKDLQSFLDLYYRGTQVLRDEDDFYRLTRHYLQKATEQNVRHAEIFFDPQAHTARGIKFETIVAGIHRALADAELIYVVTDELGGIGLVGAGGVEPPSGPGTNGDERPIRPLSNSAPLCVPYVSHKALCRQVTLCVEEI